TSRPAAAIGDQDTAAHDGAAGLTRGQSARSRAKDRAAMRHRGGVSAPAAANSGICVNNPCTPRQESEVSNGISTMCQLEASNKPLVHDQHARQFLLYGLLKCTLYENSSERSAEL